MKISPTEISPARFNKLTSIVQSVDDKQVVKLTEFLKNTMQAAELVREQCKVLAQANNDMNQEVRASYRSKHKAFDSLEKQSNDFNDFINQVSDANFLLVAFDAVRSIQQGYIGLIDLARGLKPKPLILSGKKFDGSHKSFEDIQHMIYEFELNASAINRFMLSIESISSLQSKIDDIANKVYKSLEVYYRRLLHRHTLEGIPIFKDPVITDIAITVFKNIDSHGEVAEGTEPDAVSAYTVRKAEILAGALKEKTIHKFVKDPGSLIEYLIMNLAALNNAAINLQILFQDQVSSYKELSEENSLWGQQSLSQLDKMLNALSFETITTLIEDVDPRNVSYKEPNKLLSSEEMFQTKFRDETLKEITNILADSKFSAQDLVQYVLKRKAKLKKFFQDENSFYVTKIGGGNPFTGEAPGGLSIIPGEKPNTNLDNIVGTGFKEVKQFIKNIEDSAKWNSLFLATSPSKTTDKSNVLLVGPQGAGKTEVFRAVASDKKSISISVQGSDFNTCWKGEMEKNPKRLFEGALKLYKESNKHVHILIDEIDAVLNNDKSYGETNLTLEFQILMDGVVNYPSISIWGATNNPERIPMPMIRRFSNVTIVGELNHDNRAYLLKHFMNYMPLKGFTDDVWDSVSSRLDGATGDVIRKVCDGVWRKYMSGFVKYHPDAAEELVSWLNGDTKFDIAKFDSTKRNFFKKKLAKYSIVHPEDLQKSTTEHLSNIAILAEINSAKETYRKSREFLSGINHF